MKKTSYCVLRIGIAISFLWIGVLIFKSPEGWGNMIQPWAATLLPVPLKEAMLGTAVVDILIGILLFIDLWTWLAALIGTLHITVVLVTTGITEITVRDIGLLAATLALAINTSPAWLRSKVMFLKTLE